MLTVSEKAKQHLKEMLLEHTDDPEVGLRLSPGPSGQLGLALSREESGDQVIMHEGAKVLLVASEMNALLDNATLDVQDSLDGPAFSFSLFERGRA
jgi:Fe-S cluster assembly iron-binding protein IscA